MSTLRVGLLLCDHLDPDVVAQVGDYTELFPDRFSSHGLELVVHDVTAGEMPGDLDGVDGWMISGSRRSVYDDEPWIRELEALTAELVEARRPLVGICFGHQMVARALGGHVEQADVGWGVGARTFDLTATAPWIDPATERYSLLMSHRDQVVRLPEGAQVLATAGYCPVGAYHIDENVFCVQGHPEWVPELSRTLMHRRVDAIGQAVVDAGLASLDEAGDQDLVARWIADFFRHATRG